MVYYNPGERMAMMYYLMKNVHTDLYSETGYPISPIRSRTEALPITDTELHSKIGYPSTLIRSRNEAPPITCSKAIPHSKNRISESSYKDSN